MKLKVTVDDKTLVEIEGDLDDVLAIVESDLFDYFFEDEEEEVRERCENRKPPCIPHIPTEPGWPYTQKFDFIPLRSDYRPPLPPKFPSKITWEPNEG